MLPLVDEYEPPPLSRLERLVLETDIREGSFDEQCQRYREYLRAEIAKRLREVAKGERVEVGCSICGEMTDVSRSQAEKLNREPARHLQPTFARPALVYSRS